jgi:hypothetical protein
MNTRTTQPPRRRKGARPSTHPRVSIAAALAALVILGAAGRAQADQLHVSNVYYNTGSETIAATVTARGALNTAIALALASGHCPARPEESDVQPSVTADGRPHQLLASRPAEGGSGRVLLCVWTIRTDQTISARYEQPVTLSRLRAPVSINPFAGTSHPWWWTFAGWATLVIVVLAGGGILYGLKRLIRLGHRQLRRRFPSDGDEETLGAWQQAAADAATAPPDAAPADPPTLEMEAVKPPAGTPSPRRGEPAVETTSPRTPRPAPSQTGHPFVAPAPEDPPPAAADQQNPPDPDPADNSPDRE